MGAIIAVDLTVYAATIGLMNYTVMAVLIGATIGFSYAVEYHLGWRANNG